MHKPYCGILTTLSETSLLNDSFLELSRGVLWVCIQNVYNFKIPTLAAAENCVIVPSPLPDSAGREKKGSNLFGYEALKEFGGGVGQGS